MPSDDTEEAGDSHVGPIIFADETARGQLEDHGKVATFRKTKRTTGDTWWRTSRLGPKEGDVRVTEIGPLNPFEFDDAHSPKESDLKLEDYTHLSGFDSTDDWRGAIRDLNGGPCDGYLYMAELIDQ